MLLFLYAGDIGTFAIHVVNYLGFGVAAIAAGFLIAPRVGHSRSSSTRRSSSW